MRGYLRTYTIPPLAPTWDAPAPVEEDQVSHTKKYRKAMALRDELGLTDEERYSLALLIPGVDKDGDGSWKDLTNKQLHDLITMMEGHIYLTYLMIQREQ